MKGLTLPELLCVLAIIGITTAIVAAPLGHALDRIAVDEAADRYAAMHETTRQLAIARSALARLELDTASGTVTASWRGSAGTWDTLVAHSLGAVDVAASQAVVAFTPYGYGWGFSNTTIVVRRGAVAETLTVSRTGRLKRW